MTEDLDAILDLRYYKGVVSFIYEITPELSLVGYDERNVDNKDRAGMPAHLRRIFEEREKFLSIVRNYLLSDSEDKSPLAAARHYDGKKTEPLEKELSLVLYINEDSTKAIVTDVLSLLFGQVPKGYQCHGKRTLDKQNRILGMNFGEPKTKKSIVFKTDNDNTHYVHIELGNQTTS